MSTASSSSSKSPWSDMMGYYLPIRTVTLTEVLNLRPSFTKLWKHGLFKFSMLNL